MLLLVGAIVFVTQNSHSGDDAQANAAAASSTNKSTTDPLDQLSSADIAVNAALMASMPETTAVVNQADSVSAELAVTPAGSTVVSKPQEVTTALKSRKDIQTYAILPGDTVSSVAAKFGVTSDSIRWSNNISGDALTAGNKITIPPVTGIVYTVKSGDTADSLAAKYKTSKEQIIAYNDAEISGIFAGEQIIIPNGQQPVATTSVYAGALGYLGGSATFGGYNGYDYGYCTYYAAKRRAELGNPVPSNLGNAYTWVSRAGAFGIPTGSVPRPGAVAMKHSGSPGHVAIVEVVNDDGSFWISEMNSYGQVSMTNSTPTGGWGRVDWKLIPASLAGTYGYIY